MNNAQQTARMKAKLRTWREDPISFVRSEFGVEPDAWQAEALAAFPHSQRIAIKSAKGPGKTTFLSWAIWNFLATRPYAKVAATSISADNLSDTLWAELAKWQSRSAFLRETFVWSKTRISYRAAPENWFCTARSWSRAADAQQQADTLSGIHADFCMFVLDESGSIPQAVMAACEPVLSTGIETKILQCGNPTSTEGPLWRACTEERHLWTVIEITGDPDDPRRSPRIDLNYAKEMIQKYGRENPFVLVNILAKFPPSSLNALIGPDEVRAAMGKHLRENEYNWSQRRLGVDCARFGDDRTVLFPRQGRAAFHPEVMRGARGTEIAARIALAQQQFEAEMILIDATGGWGQSTTDQLHAAGFTPIDVQFHGPPLNGKYKNRRAEMWISMTDWIRSGGALPDIPELVGELTTPTYFFNAGKLQLEEKDMIKARLGRSPDLADALALTFAMPERPAAARFGDPAFPGRTGSFALMNSDPFADDDRDQSNPSRIRQPLDWHKLTKRP